MALSLARLGLNSVDTHVWSGTLRVGWRLGGDSGAAVSVRTNVRCRDTLRVLGAGTQSNKPCDCESRTKIHKPIPFLDLPAQH